MKEDLYASEELVVDARQRERSAAEQAISPHRYGAVEEDLKIIVWAVPDYAAHALIPTKL